VFNIHAAKVRFFYVLKVSWEINVFLILFWACPCGAGFRHSLFYHAKACKKSSNNASIPHAISSFSQRDGLNENPFAQRSGVKDCSESPTHRDTPK